MRKYIIASLLSLLSTTVLHAENEELTFEAENGTISQSEIVSDSKYSGGKAVKMTDGAASLTLNVEVPERMKYKLIVTAEGIGGEKTVNCSVNGATSAFKTQMYGEVEIGTFIFTKGDNTVKITPNWTWFNIDFIRLVPVSENSQFEIDSTPVTPDATTSTQTLYTFLKDNFGKRTIAGMMTGNMDKAGTDIKAHEDVMAVYHASEKYPALVGFDFMNATGVEVDKGNNWYVEYTQKAIALAKDLWKNGGIPNFSWHWRDPSRETGEFYSEKAKINFTKAMNTDGSWDIESDLYKNIIKDIDCVADYFLDLQSEGVACIFRPLHEAPGGWFWWGTQGGEAYAKLYRLVFDEMNNKGVRNLIWDWNADYQKESIWCPGTEYYDVISTDIYNHAFDYSSNYPAFDKLQDLSEGKKIITLAENGPIPDIDLQEEEGAMWSWWMPWYQSWNGGFVDQTSKEQWKKCMGDSRVITLEDMPGWNAESTISSIGMDTQIPAMTFTIDGIKVSTRTNRAFCIINGKKVYSKAE